ncbi:hypothetical protein H6G76_31015 [Nostoc sp. FACHB-152]|uniref:hypothetical protein n=1 Tax=Nostoc sp. FACHB-152 TaxID=2692837 RepID=UPI00168244A4|nr:hypothetical protein [Nostoc sp. FACHB-152]MBD2451477.1 hypothetical protein [Nostoc sp. FACHB-152]
MNQLQIQSLSVINNCTLLVFYTSCKCWQFRVVSQDGLVFDSNQIFYTPQVAKEACISWVNGENINENIKL